MSANGRRAKRFLSAEQKYDLWVRMLTRQVTTVEAAHEAGVDRSTIMTLKRVARDGAIAALEASKPGRRKPAAGETGPSAWRSRPAVDSDRRASHRAGGAAGKSGLGMSGRSPPVSTRPPRRSCWT